MKNNKIFKIALEKAVKNGYESEITYDEHFDQFMILDKDGGFYLPSLIEIIFRHNFAKAFFGELPYRITGIIGWEPKDILNLTLKPAKITISTYQYHLQQMVLEENPIKYLEKFL